MFILVGLIVVISFFYYATECIIGRQGVMLFYYYLSLTVVIDLSLVILFVVKSIGDKGVLVIARKVLGQYSTVYGQQLDYEYPQEFQIHSQISRIF